MEMSEDELLELEKQLSCPQGQKGIELGRNMSKTNMGMILRSIEFLHIKPQQVVLELGHGNGGHIEKLLDLTSGIRYFGLEVSETMMKEAEKVCANKQAEFSLYDGENIPFDDHYFDRIISVNTLYFWSNPQKLIKEIERTLKPGGLCVLTFGNKKFMETLPFIRDRFRLFDKSDMQTLVKFSSMDMLAFKDKVEQVESKAGNLVERSYTMVQLGKLSQ